jgi:hypothetical protein
MPEEESSFIAISSRMVLLSIKTDITGRKNQRWEIETYIEASYRTKEFKMAKHQFWATIQSNLKRKVKLYPF